MKGVTIRRGMTDFWLTLNPSDLRNPLVLELAGIEILADAMPSAAAAMRNMPGISSNPVAVAEFFHYLCEAFFANLLRSGHDVLGIFGNVSAHYGVVETNGRGMFHIHCLIWLAGDFSYEEMRYRVLNDSDFANRLITFLETIITNTVENATADYEPLLYQNVPDFSNVMSDDEFYHQLLSDSHTIASKCQLHSSDHNATCFKYGNKSKCRFGMPRELVTMSFVDDFGVVHL
jgi:hypothetical protein